MVKNNGISLLFFVGFVILGLLASNLLVLGSYLLKGGTFAIALQSSDAILQSMNASELLISQLCSQVFSLILPAFLYAKFNQNFKKDLNHQIFRIDSFILFLIFFISCIPLVGFRAYLNQLITFPEWMSTNENRLNEFILKMLDFKSIGDLIIGIIVIALIPAIAEEWVFRGILQNQFIRWTHKRWLSIIIGAIIFSAIHMQFQGFLPRFVLGFALGFVYLFSGNLWYSILLHFLNNGIQVVAAYLYKEELTKQMEAKPEMPNLLGLNISLFIMLFSAYLIISKYNLNKHV